MKIYIAGPMRGLVGWNFEAFDLAAARLRAAGHVPYNPAAVAREFGYTSDSDGEDPHHLRHVILGDIACVLASDAVAVLPGWERSRGATVEVSLALFLGLPVLDAVTLERKYVRSLPWSLLNRHEEV